MEITLLIFRVNIFSRAVSKFYVENLHDFVENPELMMKYRNIWQDGEAFVSWLTGTNIDIGSDTLEITEFFFSKLTYTFYKAP